MKKKYQMKGKSGLSTFYKERKRQQETRFAQSLVDEEQYTSPFIEFANDPRYLYAYVTTSSALSPSLNMAFLYDSTKNRIKCLNMCTNKIVRTSFLFFKTINIEEMFECNPNYDHSYSDYFLYVFLKNGDRKRFLSIPRLDIYWYEPFLWISDIVSKEEGEWPCLVRLKDKTRIFIFTILRCISFGKASLRFGQAEAKLKNYYNLYKKGNLFSRWIDDKRWRNFGSL